MKLITPSLLNSARYYYTYQAESEEQDAASRAEWLATLRREKRPPNEAMQAGIDFEDSVRNCSFTEEPEPVRAIAEIVKGGMWQEVVKRELGSYLLYGRTDVILRDTVYDIKYTSNYDLGKYQDSAQHPLYMFCSGLPHFAYLISNGREWWREDYAAVNPEADIKAKIYELEGWLKNDSEAGELYNKHWGAK